MVELIVSEQHGSETHAAHWLSGMEMAGVPIGATTEMVQNIMHFKLATEMLRVAESHAGFAPTTNGAQQSGRYIFSYLPERTWSVVGNTGSTEKFLIQAELVRKQQPRLHDLNRAYPAWN